MNGACTTPIALTELIAYRQAELAESRSAEIEEHFFACASCAGRLEALEALGAAVVEAVQGGRVSAAVSDALVARAGAGGLKLRVYRLAASERVACTAAPDDDFVVIRLALDAEDAESADLAAEITVLETGERFEQLTCDIPIDRASRELVLLYAGDRVRALPRTEWQLRARVRGARGERELGPFTLDHSPWPAAPHG